MKRKNGKSINAWRRVSPHAVTVNGAMSTGPLGRGSRWSDARRVSGSLLLLALVALSTFPAVAFDSMPPGDITVLTAGTGIISSIQSMWTAPGDDGTIDTATANDLHRRTDVAITSEEW